MSTVVTQPAPDTMPEGIPPGSLVVVGEDGKPVVMYTPTGAKALEYHACTVPNALLEGPRGTGKSTILRNDAHARALAYPGFKYLVLRRTMPQLRKSHLNFIDAEMKKLGGYFNKTESVAYYPEIDGKQSKGFFSHCETDADVLNLLSSEFDLIIFDEMTTFTLDMILKISACARVPEGCGRVALVRGGTNPLGESAADVERYFISRSVTPDENPDYDPNDFIAIRMTLEDNPHIDKEQYRKRLATLPAHYRRAWLEGVWEVEGAYFSDFNPTRRDDNGDQHPWHVIETLPTVKGRPLLEQPWISIYRVVDFGFDPDPAVCTWIAMLPSGRAIVFKEKDWRRTTAAEIAKDIVRESAGMRVVETFADPSMFIDGRGTGMSVADYYEMNGVPLTPSHNDRAACGLAIHEWLNTVIDGEPKLQMLRTGVPTLIRTLPEMRQDKRDPSKIADGNDHWVISLGYFCQAWVVPSREAVIGGVNNLPLWMRKPSTRQVLGSSQVQYRQAA